MNDATNNGGKLDKLIRRQADLKAAIAALRAEKKRQKELNREMAAKIHTLIGEAMVADVEAADTAKRGGRKSYISEVLDRYYEEKSSARTLLENGGWL
jgi:hypothetical protein